MISSISKAWRAVVIGGSAGGTRMLVELLSSLPSEFPLPVIVCLHLHPSDEGHLVDHLHNCSVLDVMEATDKLPIESESVYVAPADYHLLVERGMTFALSVDEKVNGSRPSIDVLFESAAYALAKALVGILLSGSNEDGAEGLSIIQSMGGLTIAQDPTTAEHPEMPRAAVERRAARKVLSPVEIRDLVARLVRKNGA